jgi:hypothetical protein
MKQMRAPIIVAIAISTGVIVLLGYFVPLPLLQNLRLIFLGWGVTLMGVAALLGVVNLIQVHLKKLREPKKNGWMSLFLVAAFVVTLGFGLWLTPASPDFQQVVNAIQVPLETSLMAMLAVTLAYTSLRLLKRKRDLFSILFVFSALFFLILGSGVLPFINQIPVLSGLLGFIERLPLAGARGILLGVALGSIATGLRILIGLDRPYSG